MRRSRLGRIRECVRDRRYDMTAHAMEEMAEDSLDILDVEQALLTGRIQRTASDDPRGARCVVIGRAVDARRTMGIVVRFVEADRFLIITVYEVT